MAEDILPNVQPLGHAVCAALRQEITKLGLELPGEPDWQTARLSQRVDPYSKEVTHLASWQGEVRNGEIQFFADGRVFAEYHVLLPLPQDDTQYVEAVQVWGTAARLMGEPVLARFADH